MTRFKALMLLGAAVISTTAAPFGANSSHAPIVIANDSDFQTCSCVSGGSGTTTNPYIIGPLTTNSLAPGGIGLSVDGAPLTKSFTLFNLTIAGNSSASSAGIVLNHINPSGQNTISAVVTGPQTSIQNAGIGIVVANSSFVTLDGGGANPNGAGIGIGSAGTINKNSIGAVDVENSSNITVRGWQFSANGQDNTPDWIAFNPSLANWGVGAVRLFGSSYSLIDHNAANNCTTVSFAVFNSSHNMISNNTADYPFTNNLLITDGSSYNTASNNVFGTADFIGILIADPLPGTPTLSQYGPAHDNLIQGNLDHSDGPTGAETHSGIVPSFVGAIVILNGTYNNTIMGNQVIGPLTDLAWAQEILDPNSSIGVEIGPPVVHSNVTASEGGGGVANLNGNLWSGNTALKIDSCITQQ